MIKKLDSLIQNIPIKILRQAAQDISLRYRNQDKPYLNQKEHYLAYLVTRFPATFTVVSQVLKKVSDFDIHSLLDLGAGPGTGFLAAEEIFSQLSQVTLLETDPEFISLGKQLIEKPVNWQQAHLPCSLAPHDLVLMSYSLNEINELETVIANAWQAAQKLLVIIEPGTPQGYARIIKAREYLLAQGAHMIAPCPHALACPLQDQDWCHFPARVARSKLHRQLKGGELAFEDEKFSYLIVGKNNYLLPNARIIAKPKIHPGWVELSLCTQGQIEQKVFRHREKELYKQAKKLSWGDEL